MSFERPIGASADMQELEYIASLHQTCPELRKDGSIQAIDVVHFLNSRYGIRVSVKEVQDTILKGLGGGDDEEECIDLMEVVAILIIPELLKAAQSLLKENEKLLPPSRRQDFASDLEYKQHVRLYKITEKRKPDSELVANVLDMILKDTVGLGDSPPTLNRQLITDIFSAYGEENLVRNQELIDDMIAAASTSNTDIEENGGAIFDKFAFARALTSDVQSYNIGWETELTTHYYDVFQTIYSTKTTRGIRRASLPFWLDKPKETNQLDRTTEETEEIGQSLKNEETRPVERAFTFPAIDYIAGTYRSKVFVIVLWVCGVATYFAYLWDFEVAFGRVDCSGITNRGHLFGCRIVNGIINWLVIMLELRYVLFPISAR